MNERKTYFSSRTSIKIFLKCYYIELLINLINMIASPSRQKVLSLRYVNNSLSQIKDTNAIILFILRMYTDINNIIHLFFFQEH